ncbi:MAG: MATE family efflux transporter [Planctomycetales bacterium]|nr:MATE family efflux transporter [Planctomycetales bacterium]
MTKQHINPEHQKYRLNLRPATLNRTIALMAAPAILENLLFSLVFFADTLIVGWLRNENYLAATALASLMMFWTNAPIQAMSIATVSIVSRTLGENDYVNARRFAGHSLVMTFMVVFAALAVGIPYAEFIIRLFKAEPPVVPLATAYLRIVLLSSIFGLPLMVSNAVIRAKGDTATPMYITLIMNIINIFASIVLAFGWGPFPAMSLYGVAWGTVLARNVGGLLSLAVLVSQKWGIRIRGRDFFPLHRRTFARIWHVAYPAIAERVLNATSYAFFMGMVASLGTTVLAAHQIALNVESLAFMPAFGMGVAVTTIFGQAVGSGRWLIGQVTVKRSIWFSVTLSVVLGILFVAFAPQGVKVFRATPEVLRLGGLALQLAALELPFFALTFIFMGALRGAGDTRSPLYVNVACILLLRLPFTWLLAFVLNWGIVGVWIATALDWGGRSLGLWLIFRRGIWKTAHHAEKQKFADPIVSVSSAAPE